MKKIESSVQNNWMSVMTDFWNIVIYKIITVYYGYFKERCS